MKLGCGVAGLGEQSRGSVSLVLSDLPSGETQAPFDKKPNLPELWQATWHALCPGGVAVFMASSLVFAAELIASQPKAYRYDMVWKKSLATGHLNARRRPLRAHEFILVFSLGAHHTYRPQLWYAGKPINACTRTSNGDNYGASKATRSRAGATDRYPVSVLAYASVGTSSKDRTHPQQKPEDLLRYLVRTYSVDDALVVDPFAGSGSTGRAALAEGRRFLGWDSDPRFGELNP